MSEAGSQSSAPMTKIKLVVSDFHIGKGAYLQDNTVNILEDFPDDRKFVEFLEFHSSGKFRDAEVELIINGDFLNLPQIDFDGVIYVTPTERMLAEAMEKIVDGHQVLFRGILEFLRLPGKELTYVIGNHDMGMASPLPQGVFNRAVGTEINYVNGTYCFDGFHIEHGHRYEALNYVNPRKQFVEGENGERQLQYPWGTVFCIEMLTEMKKERPYVDKVRPFSVFIRWSLLHDTFWSLKWGVKVTLYFLFKRPPSIKPSKVSGFLDRVRIFLGLSFYPSFLRQAIRLLKRREHLHTVIFGHTHIPRYIQWRGGKVYINTGAWGEVTNLEIGDFGTRARFTYAHIEYIENPSPENLPPPRPKVVLKEWKGQWHPTEEVAV